MEPSSRLQYNTIMNELNHAYNRYFNATQNSKNFVLMTDLKNDKTN